MRAAGGNLAGRTSVRPVACQYCTPSLIRFSSGVIATGNQLIFICCAEHHPSGHLPPGGRHAPSVPKYNSHFIYLTKKPCSFQWLSLHFFPDSKNPMPPLEGRWPTGPEGCADSAMQSRQTTPQSASLTDRKNTRRWAGVLLTSSAGAPAFPARPGTGAGNWGSGRRRWGLRRCPPSGRR